MSRARCCDYQEYVRSLTLTTQTTRHNLHMTTVFRVRPNEQEGLGSIGAHRRTLACYHSSINLRAVTLFSFSLLKWCISNYDTVPYLTCSAVTFITVNVKSELNQAHRKFITQLRPFQSHVLLREAVPSTL